MTLQMLGLKNFTLGELQNSGICDCAVADMPTDYGVLGVIVDWSKVLLIS